jgi:hypothetical protein
LKTDAVQKDGLRLSIAILVGLLLLRLLHLPIATWIWHATPPDYELMPFWYDEAYEAAAYLLVCCGIWVNSKHLLASNVDRPFAWLTVLAGILNILFYVPSIMGAAVAFACLKTLRMLFAPQLEFGPGRPDYARAIRPTLIGLAPSLVLFLVFLAIGRGTRLTISGLESALYLAGLPRVMVEEYMFRGLSWMVLKRLGASDMLAFGVQAGLFWLAHLHYLNQPVMLWFWVPYTAIWLGLVVRRSSSLALSSCTHSVFNFVATVLKS